MSHSPRGTTEIFGLCLGVHQGDSVCVGERRGRFRLWGRGGKGHWLKRMVDGWVLMRMRSSRSVCVEQGSGAGFSGADKGDGYRRKLSQKALKPKHTHTKHVSALILCYPHLSVLLPQWHCALSAFLRWGMKIKSCLEASLLGLSIYQSHLAGGSSISTSVASSGGVVGKKSIPR